MTTIQAIEAKSVHQIQSGQVIVDLCSVVKELVENSLDANATSIEVRFKNNGLDSVEVQDNGSGIAASNYANVALKHHTSKLSTYDDLSSLDTFGFRGEALSSLCALSQFSVVTAQANEAPKGQRLEFELSGALKSTATVAAPRGTTVIVEDLFARLPVRQKELSKNIKREYGKVLGLLYAYACIGTDVKFSIKNAMPKAKSMVVFSTQGNATTRDNIANVYGAKTLTALIPLDLDLDLQPTLNQIAPDKTHTKHVKVVGHLSKPVFGEGRQTPDRQMFFVNGRPCGLPQIAKAMNEIYRSFNVSQSPFIFADFRMDTNAYDVNVSPDKRSIMLHNAAALIERLRECLSAMFDEQDHTVPQSQTQSSKLPAFRQLHVHKLPASELRTPTDRRLSTKPSLTDDLTGADGGGSDEEETANSLLHSHFRAQASTREEVDDKAREKLEKRKLKDQERQAEKVTRATAEQEEIRVREGADEYDGIGEIQSRDSEEAYEEETNETPRDIRVRDFTARMAEQQMHRRSDENDQETPTREAQIAVVRVVRAKDPPGIVQNAFSTMRPPRAKAQFAEITIDNETTTIEIGAQAQRVGLQSTSTKRAQNGSEDPSNTHSASRFSQGLKRFGAERRPFDDGDEPEMQSAPDSNDEGSSGADDTDRDEFHASENGVSDSVENAGEDGDSDSEYEHDEERKAPEDARVAELIRLAEESGAPPSRGNMQRANKTLKGGGLKYGTTNLMATLDISLQALENQMAFLDQVLAKYRSSKVTTASAEVNVGSEEERLSLTVTKDDFASMQLVGQFNLGFIIAVRPSTSVQDNPGQSRDELFIIDQHASDEKYNFERLQIETTVGNQRMVRPVLLDLTAVEEEIVLENTTALEQNGFVVNVDTSGDQPVGRRCTLVSLPLSKEVVFDTRDLDELIHLLSELPNLGAESTVPRPARVRKMFAMRACRSSIMIGRPLSKKQMRTVVSHMGTIAKPWNCPHGRPTMRHLTSLEAFDTWQEGDGLLVDPETLTGTSSGSVWAEYLAS